MMRLKGWTVRESFDPDVYFSGMSADNKPVFEPLCCRTRVYKSERAAASAIRIITDRGYEGAPEEQYIDGIEVDDEIPDIPPEPQTVPLPEDSPYEKIISEVLKPPEGWRILDHFGKSLALLYNGEHFAIRNKDASRLFEDGKTAAQEWCSIRSKIFTARIEKLGGAS